jgi:hypothetical protein
MLRKLSALCCAIAFAVTANGLLAQEIIQISSSTQIHKHRRGSSYLINNADTLLKAMRLHYDSGAFIVKEQYTGTSRPAVGIVDTSGTEILPPDYRRIVPEWHDDDMDVFSVLSHDQKRGLFSPQQGWVRKPEYTNVQCYAAGERLLCIIKQIDGYGIVDQHGDQVLDFHYPEITLHQSEGLLLLNDGACKYVMTLEMDSLVSGCYQYVRLLQDVIILGSGNTYALWDLETMEMLVEGAEEIRNVPAASRNFFAVMKNGKYALYNRQARTFTPFIYDAIKESLAPLYKRLIKTQYFEVSVMDSVGAEPRIGLIRGEDGKMIAPPQYDQIRNIENRYAFLERNGRYALVDLLQDTQTTLKYCYIPRIHKDTLIVLCEWRGEEKRYSLWNVATGETVIPPTYEMMRQEGQYLVVKDHGLYGVLNQKGEAILAPEFEHPLTIWHDSLLLEKVGAQRYRVMNMQGNRIRDWLIAEHILFDLFPIPIEKDGLYGYADKNLNIVIEPMYEAAEFFEYGRGIVRSGGKYGVVNAANETCVPFEYDDIRLTVILDDDMIRGPSSRGAVYMVTQDEKQGVASCEGVLVPVVYDNVYRALDNVLTASIGDRIDLYSPEGMPLVPEKTKVVDRRDQILIVEKDGLRGLQRMDGTELLATQIDAI